MGILDLVCLDIMLRHQQVSLVISILKWLTHSTSVYGVSVCYGNVVVQSQELHSPYSTCVQGTCQSSTTFSDAQNDVNIKVLEGLQRVSLV